MNIDLGDINYLAVIVGVIIGMVGGGAWYGVFAGPWSAEVGITREEVQAQPWSERWRPFGVAVVGAILLTMALAIFVQAAGATEVVDGLVVGLIAGIGFVAAGLASNHAFMSPGPATLYVDPARRGTYNRLKTPSPQSGARVEAAVSAESAMADLPKAALRIRGGPDDGRTFNIRKGITTIGRADNNDVVVEDSAVSRHHAGIRMDPSGYWLEDLGSRHGTYLNGQLLEGEGQRLHDSDRIHLGGCSSIHWVFTEMGATVGITLPHQK